MKKDLYPYSLPRRCCCAHFTACSSKDEAAYEQRVCRRHQRKRQRYDQASAVALDSDDENLSNLFTWYEWDKGV